MDEGFWCGVVSVIIAGINTVCLILHYHFAYKHDDVDSKKLQLTGRKFMLSVTGLFVLIGFQGLAYNRLEGWKYFDAIYFSVQTTLTVGYGDFVPTTAWSKILLFPFAILTIAQLANQISIIINFIQDRAAERRDKWRKRYSIAMHRVALQKKPYATLIEEICLIHQIELHQQRWVASCQVSALTLQPAPSVQPYLVVRRPDHLLRCWSCLLLRYRALGLW